jgi:hypothetical protein
MTVGGVDTYYDYEEQQWKHRKLGGGPVRPGPVCPSEEDEKPVRGSSDDEGRPAEAAPNG